MPLDVHPALDLRLSPDRAVVEARVLADPPRPVDWRLTVETAGNGGVSRIAQAGNTSGVDQRPVAVVTVNAPGSAVLQIVQGSRVIAETRLTIPKP